MIPKLKCIEGRSFLFFVLTLYAICNIYNFVHLNCMKSWLYQIHQFQFVHMGLWNCYVYNNLSLKYLALCSYITR